MERFKQWELYFMKKSSCRWRFFISTLFAAYIIGTFAFPKFLTTTFGAPYFIMPLYIDQIRDTISIALKLFGKF